MDYYILASIFVLGAIIGSFLNVVIYRLHTGRSLNGRSHCLSCTEPLHWYELLPIVSYIGLRARCRTCASFIPVRYLLVELTVALSFLWMWTIFSPDIVLTFLYFIVMAVLVVIVVYDMYHTIIPDEFVIYLLLVTGLILGYTYFFAEVTLMELFYTVSSGILGALFFASFWKVSGGKWMGLGDAKLMLPLGMLLGPMGTFSAIVLSFWIGAFVSVCILLIQKLFQAGKTRVPFLRVQLTIKSEIPFAPFLVAGFLSVHFLHVDIFSIIELFLPLS